MGEVLLVPPRIEASAMDSRASSAGDDPVGSSSRRSRCSEVVRHPSLSSVWETLGVNALRSVKRDGLHIIGSECSCAFFYYSIAVFFVSGSVVFRIWLREVSLGDAKLQPVLLLVRLLRSAKVIRV